MPQDTATDLDRLESFETLQNLLEPASPRHSADPQTLLDAVKRAQSLNERSARIDPELAAFERELAELVPARRSICEAFGKSQLAFEYALAMGELAYFENLFRDTGRPELVPILRKLAERLVATISRCEASGEKVSDSDTEFLLAVGDYVVARYTHSIVDQECREREHIIERIQKQPPAETCSPATARTTGDRDAIRRARPRRGARPARGSDDAEPDLNAIAENISTTYVKPALVALLTQLIATLRAGHSDPWIHQKDSPYPVRNFTQDCRKGRACGDARAAVRGRVHYMRQSLIDEILRGAPQPKRVPNKVASEAHLSPLESLKRDFALAIEEAAE